MLQLKAYHNSQRYKEGIREDELSAAPVTEPTSSWCTGKFIIEKDKLAKVCLSPFLVNQVSAWLAFLSYRRTRGTEYVVLRDGSVELLGESKVMLYP